MKKLYFLVLALCLCSSLTGQNIVFGNATFKSRLINANKENGFARDKDGVNIIIDTNGDKEIDASEALQVYYLDVSTKNNNDLQIFNIIGIEYFKNLRSLNYRSNRVSGADLRPLIYLEDLDCSYNTDFPVGINLEGLNLKRLDASGTGLMKPYLTAEGNVGLSQFPNLEILICNSTTITAMNFTGLKKLKTLDISQNMLKSINLTDLVSLEKLDCVHNLLTELDLSACKNLISVNASQNKISSLAIKDMPKLEDIVMYENTLLKEANLENLPYLKKLTINNCILNELNLSGVSALESLNCSNNKLLNLDLNKCSSLKDVSCNFNSLLTSLNISGSENLETLKCSNTSLSALDLKKNLHLKILGASSTKVQFLDLSPLKELLDVTLTGNNSLHYLLLKNGKRYQSYFLSAPNLKYLCVDDENINYYKQILPQFGINNCEINTYCNFVPGNAYYVIKGVNKYNFDNNGCVANNSVFPNLKYTITNGTNSGSFYSANNSSYAIPVQAGEITIQPIIENSNYFTVSPASVTINFPTQTSPYIQDFCISSNSSQPDLEIVLIPTEAARPGFDAKYKLVYRNKGNITQSGTVNLTFNDAVLDLKASNPLSENQTTNNLSWSFSNLPPFETKEITLTFKINKPTDTPAVNNGDILKFKTTITSEDTDKTPLDNTFALNQTVVGSYDPNDKTCLEGTVITPSLIGEYVHYMIRFENTGTYPAQNIVVKDMIDLNKFDIATLIPTSSSHSFVTKISETNKVEFIFEGINLPFDDANNDGYIAFKIKTKPTLRVGDTFTNEANIYFDYNFPILTNKAASTFTALGTKDFEFSNYVTLYPNPANNVLNINSKESIEIQSIAIYDILGQLVIAVPNAKAVSSIDISKLNPGNYFIKVKSDKGSSSIKFIKN